MRHIFLALLLLSVATSLPAQWRGALLVGNASSHGDARSDSDPGHPELRAERPSTWTLALTHQAGPWRIGVDLHRTSAALAEASASSTVVAPDALKAWGSGVELARRVAGRTGSAELMMGIGASVDRWTFVLDESSPRWRPAARAALEALFPFGPRWAAAIRAQLSAGPSVFKADELPDGFSSRMARRLGVSFGLARSL